MYTLLVGFRFAMVKNNLLRIPQDNTLVPHILNLIDSPHHLSPVRAGAEMVIQRPPDESVKERVFVWV